MKPTVNMVGRLTRDVTNVFSNADGSANRCLFTVACNSRYKAADNTKKESVDFIPCIAWSGSVPVLTKWGLKGRLIHIEGALEAFQAGPNENGQYPPAKVQVRVERLEFLDKKPEGVETPDQTPAPGAATPDFDMNKMAELVAQKLLGATNANTNASATDQQVAAGDTADQQAGLNSVT